MEKQDEFEENNLLIPNEEIVTALKGVVGEEDANSFLEFAQDIQNEKLENSTILVFKSAFTEKAKRTAVHMLFKRMLKMYESDTLEQGEARYIRVFLKSAFSKNKRAKNNITTYGASATAGVRMPEYLSIAM